MLKYFYQIRKFLFLAYSNSQLRQRSSFFMTEFVYQGQLITRKYIFNDLGNFSKEKIPAKVGARIGMIIHIIFDTLLIYLYYYSTVLYNNLFSRSSSS